MGLPPLAVVGPGEYVLGAFDQSGAGGDMAVIGHEHAAAFTHAVSGDGLDPRQRGGDFVVYPCGEKVFALGSDIGGDFTIG